MSHTNKLTEVKKLSDAEVDLMIQRQMENERIERERLEQQYLELMSGDDDDWWNEYCSSCVEDGEKEKQ